MGQAIQVEAATVGDVVIFTTDRSLTGQDGVSYGSAEAAAADERFPGRLAARLFAAYPDISSVWVGSNLAVVRRADGWEDTAVDTASKVIGDFFLFYTPE